MLAAMSLLCVLAGSSAATAGDTTRLSVDSSGNQAENGWSISPSVSSDGRYVAFSSDATNLVAGDTNNRYDVFVHDRQTGATQRASVVDGSGAQASNDSFVYSISGDGRYVAFNTNAQLEAEDTNDFRDVYVHDMQTGATQRVSVDSSGSQVNGDSFAPSISADGRFVAFTSLASDLAAGGVSGSRDIYVHDRQTGTTQRVGVTGSGVFGDDGGFYPSISPDGRYVGFNSKATNLVAGDTNGVTDAFVYDRETSSTERVSVNSSGAQANGVSGSTPYISSGGRYVAFTSGGSNLVGGDTNGTYDVFVRDRQTGTTERVSLAGCGTQANDQSFEPSISSDGRYVSFLSDATNLVAGDLNVATDAFVRDRQAGTTQQVSVDGSGTHGNNSTFDSSTSGDGRYVAFASSASNLVAGDTNGLSDIFVHERPATQPNDCTAPAPPIITSPANNSFDTDGSITISGTAEAGSIVKVFEGSTSKGTTPVGSSGAWSTTLDAVGEGAHTYTAKATDAANNTSESSNPVTVKVDITKPTITATTPLNRTTNVARGTNLTATFSEQMMTSSIKGKTFKLFMVNADGTQTQITDVVVSLSSDDGLTAKLNPFGTTTTVLARNTKYKGVLTTGTKDLAGNSLAQRKSWTFTTKP
jgi:Tol biopolymer transport system component